MARGFTLIFALAAASFALLASAETYRWEEKVGDKIIVHYSDRPPPKTEKAEKVELPGAQTYTSSRTSAADTGAAQSRDVAAPPAVSCSIVSPTPEQVLLNEQSLTVQFNGPRGTQALLMLNGAPQRDSSGTPIFTISPIARGTYSAVVVFESNPGETVCRTPSVTFHVRQASLIKPAAPKPAPKPKPPPR